MKLMQLSSVPASASIFAVYLCFLFLRLLKALRDLQTSFSIRIDIPTHLSVIKVSKNEKQILPRATTSSLRLVTNCCEMLSFFALHVVYLEIPPF